MSTNLRSNIGFSVKAEFGLSGPEVAPERTIEADKGNSIGNFINDALDSMATTSVPMKEAGTDKAIFQCSN